MDGDEADGDEGKFICAPGGPTIKIDILMLCLVIYPLDFERNGHIHDDVSFWTSVIFVLSHGFLAFTANACSV